MGLLEPEVAPGAPSPESPAPADAQAFYRALFWAAADGILVADEDGHYLDANQAAVTLLGYEREALLRLSVGDVVAPGPAWAKAEYDRFRQEGTWSGELEVRRQDGNLVPVEAHATVVRRQEGGPVYISVLRDISSRRATQRAEQEFLAMMAHELKTPLTVILGSAQLMQRRASYSAEGTAAIVARARQLQRLIDDLASLAHATLGRSALRASSCDLVALAEAAALEARIVAPTHPVHVVAPEQPLVGWWDADRLAQVLQNLLANAAKYSPAGSSIRLWLQDHTDQALVSVANAGPGIGPEELPRLFDRFYRTASAAQSGTAGLGLGLAICKLLVEAHGGRIWAASTLGQETTVSFTLPYRRQQQEPPTP